MVKKQIFFGFITLIIILFDQLTKYLVEFFQPKINLIFLSIIYLQNTGAGFGIFKEQTFILSLISLAVTIIILWNYKKIPSPKVSQILFALFLGGVIGNLIDRMFRGYVVDFINFKIWPAFNIADVSISIATIGLIFYFWKK